MKELKLYLQVSVEDELPKDDEFYHTNEGKCIYQPANKCWFDIRGDYANPEWWLKPPPLTLSELMVGFAYKEYSNEFQVTYPDQVKQDIRQRVLEYLTEQKIILQ